MNISKQDPSKGDKGKVKPFTHYRASPSIYHSDNDPQPNVSPTQDIHTLNTQKDDDVLLQDQAIEDSVEPPNSSNSNVSAFTQFSGNVFTGLLKAQRAAKGEKAVIVEEIKEEEAKDGEDDPETVGKQLNEPGVFHMHGKEHLFSPRSIFLLRTDNPLRRKVVFTITHKFFDNFIVFMIMANALLLGIKDYTDTKNETAVNQFIENIEPLFTTCFTIECVLKIVGMGFVLDPGSYLQDPWNWLDFIVVISSLLTSIPQMKSVSGLRTLRLMRPLRSLTTMPSMKILISTLFASVAQLGGVAVLALFFFTIFAILAVSLWAGSIHRRCRLTQFPVDGDWPVDEFDTQLCSDERQCPTNRWCGSLKEARRAYKAGNKLYYIKDEVSDLRDITIEDLNFGYSSFDNIIVAFITIFQCVTLEGWIDITNIYMDAYGKRFVQFYFLLLVIVCSFFVLNLVIAVMLLKYDELENSEASSAHSDELREYGQQIGENGLPEKFTEFIIETDNIEISAKGLKILENQKEESFWTKMTRSSATFDDEDTYYKNPVTRVCFYIVNSPIFNGFILLIIVANTIMLSMDKFPDYNEKTLQIFHAINVTFTVIFTVEVVIKIIGVGGRGFVADNFNIFDATIVLVSLIELAAGTGGSKEQELAEQEESGGGGGGAFSALRAFRLFRVFKLFKSGDFRTLLDGIAFTMLSIGDYCILLSLFIYIFALLGMSSFAGKVKFNDDGELDVENGESPRINFDRVGSACLTVFYVMIGENWNSIMYNHMLGTSKAQCLYFIILVIFGNIVMLNLFLAILLGNFDKARYFGEKKKIFDAFNGMAKMGYTLSISITYLIDDQDLANYIENKILADFKEQDDERAKLDDEADKTGPKGSDVNCEHSEQEIRGLLSAMTNGRINDILSNKKQLEDEPWECVQLEEISDTQREKTVEILTYIKRQKSIQSQRDQFDEQIKLTNDQMDVIDQLQKKNVVFSSDLDQVHEKYTREWYLDYFQNSSLCVFHQNNFIRQWCQRCIINDSEEDQDEKLKQKMASSESQKSVHIPLDKQQQISPQKFQESQVGPSSQDKSQNMPSQMQIFDGIIMTLIIVNSILLAIDNPLLDPESPKKVSVSYLDNCFTVLFTLECVIKILAMGFLFNNSTLKEKNIPPYIRDPWNMLDFVVVIASLIDFVVQVKSSIAASAGNADSNSNLSANLQSLKALRALRALRPLRMISRNQGMKLIVNALLASLPAMGNVVIVCFLFLLIFAIMAVSFFKGTFGRCVLDDDELMAKVETRKDCEDFGGDWDVPIDNFDNAPKAMLTLIEMMTTEGYIDVMYNGLDGVPVKNGMEMQPKENNRKGLIIFFLIYMLFGSQFILNLFMGVIMDNFNKIRESQEKGGIFVTEDQQAWIDAQRLGLTRQLQFKIKAPDGWKRSVFNFVNLPIFEGTITFFILFNTIVMASKYDGISPGLENAFKNLNYLFAVIFNIEMILKLIALGQQYFNSGWNVFDCIVVAGTDIGIIINWFSTGSSFATAATVVRAFRIMRIVRLIRSQENLKIILDTLINIIPSISNFMTLMFLMIYIYAALGMNLFALIVQQEFINDKNNFQDIATAIIFLFRCATGEDWNKIMHEVNLREDSGICITDQDYHILTNNKGVTQGCGSSFAKIYFLSFLVLISWLILNLAVAAVIEGLENAKQENTGTISGDDVQTLIDTWEEYDPKATGWIDVEDFVCLITELPPPFGNPSVVVDGNLIKNFTKDWKNETQADFEKAQMKIYNRDSYYVNEEKLIIARKRDILLLLSEYKVHSYEGRVNKLHFKDIYYKFIKRVFLEEDSDFQISKVLKTKIKSEWLDKHKKIKELPKNEFKAHTGFASKIILRYLAAHRLKNAWNTLPKELKEKYKQQDDTIMAQEITIQGLEDDLAKKQSELDALMQKIQEGSHEDENVVEKLTQVLEQNMQLQKELSQTQKQLKESNIEVESLKEQNHELDKASANKIRQRSEPRFKEDKSKAKRFQEQHKQQHYQINEKFQNGIDLRNSQEVERAHKKGIKLNYYTSQPDTLKQQNRTHNGPFYRHQSLDVRSEYTDNQETSFNANQDILGGQSSIPETMDLKRIKIKKRTSPFTPKPLSIKSRIPETYEMQSLRSLSVKQPGLLNAIETAYKYNQRHSIFKPTKNGADPFATNRSNNRSKDLTERMNQQIPQPMSLRLATTPRRRKTSVDQKIHIRNLTKKEQLMLKNSPRQKNSNEGQSMQEQSQNLENIDKIMTQVIGRRKVDMRT